MRRVVTAAVIVVAVAGLCTLYLWRRLEIGGDQINNFSRALFVNRCIENYRADQDQLPATVEEALEWYFTKYSLPGPADRASFDADTVLSDRGIHWACHK